MDEVGRPDLKSHSTMDTYMAFLLICRARSLGPYTERIDLCFETFFAKEIRRVNE
jgi:hypothetical protein